MRERDIAEGVLRRDQAALDELGALLEREFRPFFLWQLDPDTARELVHDLFLAVYQALEERRVVHPEFLIAYARGVARHLKLRRLEERTRVLCKIVPISPRHRSPSDQERDLADAQNVSELAGLVQSVLADLSELEREIMRRAYFEREPLETIARALDLQPRQLRNLKSRAKQKFRAAYERLANQTETRPPRHSPDTVALAA